VCSEAESGPKVDGKHRLAAPCPIDREGSRNSGFSRAALPRDENQLRCAHPFSVPWKTRDHAYAHAIEQGGSVAQLDMDEFLERFGRRAKAVRERGVPPLEGEARKQFIESAENDFLDYSLVASASWTVEDGALILRIPLGT
jgi:hypothetical protein